MTVSDNGRPYILSIDQGTTSSRAVVFSLDGVPVAVSQQTFEQHYPRDGWVEHDADEIWQTVLKTSTTVLNEVGGAQNIAAIGITNQRETTVVWNRSTGAPVYNAIVWQDRRGAEACRALAETGFDKIIQDRTGLIPDSYFSATKVQWILDNDSEIRSRAENGDLAFGTIDTFLLWKLTGGAVHATDSTNASRTMLFDIHQHQWDQQLLDHFGVPLSMLPDVRNTAGDFGHTDTELFGAAIPITALVGDQQGALAGQNCLSEGMAKCTFGTGAFVLLNAGSNAPVSTNRLLTTVAYRLDNTTTYALEGSVFNAGTVVQWLRDDLGLMETAAESESMAQSAGDRDVVFVPAFTGLGAPHWDPHARGAIFGLTRDTSRADIVRAGLEAVCFQVLDLLDCMASDTRQTLDIMRVDGGMAANAWMLQTLADLTGVPVERPHYLETTVQGAALLAGLGHGLYDSVDDMALARQTDRVFEPRTSLDWRESQRRRWHGAVDRVQSG